MGTHSGIQPDQLIFNGLDGATGQYLVADVETELAAVAQAEDTDAAHLRDVQARAQAGVPSFGVVGTVEDSNDLAQTGWGVVFAEGANPAIREALSDLLSWRQEQATLQQAHYYQEYAGKRGYHAGETKDQFLSNRGAATSGPAIPDDMPYYLLLVGDPDSIPYAFQYQLDVQYAVGRIHFGTLDEYAAYARSVVTAERTNPRAAQATFFAVANPDDAATRLSSELLVGPLASAATAWQTRTRDGQPPWKVDTVSGPDATKALLVQLLGGEQTPALLFTASHGLGFAAGDARQEPLQGSLVCGDWPGPREWSHNEPLPADYYLAAEDIGDDARLLGLIAFHFACYGVGTPRMDDFPQIANGRRAAGGPLGTSLSKAIAERPFVARLPQRLLGHPRGGALAVIGHVERALGSSFTSHTRSGAHRSSLGCFEGGLSRMLRGSRVGGAMEEFNQRYADLCATLSEEIRMIQQFGKHADPLDLARMWTGSSDARGYAIFGDPAVRLVVQTQSSGSPSASTINPVSVIQPPESEPAEPPPIEMPAPEARHAATSPVGPDIDRSVRLEIDPGSGRIIVTVPLPASASAPARESTPGGDELVSFGLGSMVEDLRTSVRSSLKDAAEHLGNAVGQLVADVTSLEVATYVNEGGSAVNYDARQHAFIGQATQSAMTCIRANGDVLALVPRADGQVDRELWAVHTELVERAQAQRAEMIKTLASAVSQLLRVSSGFG